MDNEIYIHHRNGLHYAEEKYTTEGKSFIYSYLQGDTNRFQYILIREEIIGGV